MKGFQMDIFSNNTEFTYYVITYKDNYWNGSQFTFSAKNAEEFKTHTEARKQAKLISKSLKLKRKANDFIRIKPITVKVTEK